MQVEHEGRLQRFRETDGHVRSCVDPDEIRLEDYVGALVENACSRLEAGRVSFLSFCQCCLNLAPFSHRDPWLLLRRNQCVGAVLKLLCETASLDVLASICQLPSTTISPQVCSSGEALDRLIQAITEACLTQAWLDSSQVGGGCWSESILCAVGRCDPGNSPIAVLFI